MVLLLALGTALGLLVLETSARVLAVFAERREGRFDRDLGELALPRPRSLATLGQIIRKSANPRIVYELRPRLDVIFAGGHLTTSSLGHRGPEVATQKAANTRRVVGIGDSYMFGQGVSDEETYLARLPQRTPVSGPRFETVNLAVPGFNTSMEVAMLRARGQDLRPDLILIEIVGNDLDLPNFLWRAVNPWSPRRSFLLDFIRGRLSTASAPASGDLEGAPQEGRGSTETFSRDAAHVPAAYASMVGIPAFESAISDLAIFGRELGIPIRAITHGVWWEDAMKATLAKNGIPVLILRSALRKRARELGAPDYARSALALSPQDLHPSALGHQVIADEVDAFLRQAERNAAGSVGSPE